MKKLKLKKREKKLNIIKVMKKLDMLGKGITIIDII